MSAFHDEVFGEIDSARKLVAEFKRRPHGRAEETPAAGAADEALPLERLEQDAVALAPAADGADDRLEVAEMLRELAEARARERAAAEESIRKAREMQTNASGTAPVLRETAPADPVRYFWFPGIGVGHVWYFTAESERCGPVTFKDLRKMAASGVLDPRLDMVWKKGMPEWKKAGLVDGLFERNLMEKVAASAPLPRVSPVKFLRSIALMEKLASKELHWPGVGRRVLLLGALLFPILWNHLLSWVGPWLVSVFSKGVMETLIPLFIIVPPLVLAGLLLNRLTNLGMNRWWSLAMMVPLLNLWIAYRCLFCPAGYAYHRKMDRNGFVMIACFCLLAPFVWQPMLKHPVVAYGAYLQTGMRVVVERAGRIARTWL